MINAPIPTDNLYKFVAISGIAIAGFAVYIAWSSAIELLNLHHRQTLMVDQFFAEAIEWEAQLAAEGVISPQERDESIAMLMAKAKEAKAMKATKAPDANVDLDTCFEEIAKCIGEIAHPNAQEMHRHLQEKWFREKIKSDMKYDDAEYDNWAARLTLQEFTKMRASAIEHAKLLQDKAAQIASGGIEFGRSVDWFLLINRYSKWALGAGGFVALVGFVLWYFKVQRYQDKILWRQYKDATKQP
jgi:hypothetical protein